MYNNRKSYGDRDNHNNKGYNKRYSNDNRQSNKGGYNKKPDNKFNGHQNRMRLKQVEPSTYAEKVLEQLTGNKPTVDTLKYFRKSITQGHHMYKIYISNENHFCSGYSYMCVGWAFATDNYKDDAVNITIFIDPEFISQIHSDIKNLIESKALLLMSETLLMSGKPVRYCMDSATYENQKRWLPKAWVIDKNQSWPELNINKIKSEVQLKADSKVVLRNNISNTGIKLGTKLDDMLTDYLNDKFGVSMKVLPFVGCNLYCDKTILATITKCGKDKIIHFRSKDADVNFVTSIILGAVEFEQRGHKFKYNKEYDVIHDGDIEFKTKS